jgi:chitodextrinase
MRRLTAIVIGTALVVSGLVISGSASAIDSAPIDPGPAAPVNLLATNNATSIFVSWRQPTVGSRPTSFRVYEGATVVGRNTTTKATIRNLVFGSVHTYTVTAVDRFGRESAPSAPITRSAQIGGPVACGITPPSGLTATEVTASSVSLKWSNAVPFFDQSATLIVYVDGVATVQTALDSARIGGLSPATIHRFQVARRDCGGGLHFGPAITATTAPGAPGRPGAPTGLAVSARTTTSVGLSWTPSAAVSYAVYDGGTRVAATSGASVTVRGLWRDTAHQFTVTAVDAAGNESATSAPAVVSTAPCDSVPPAPVQLAAVPVSASSVALSWVSTAEATSYTVLVNGAAAATLPTPSAVITGLPSATPAGYSVVAQLSGCGVTPASATVTATTLAGPNERPNAVTDLRANIGPPSFDNTAPVTLSWTAPGPVAGYRLYEGATVLASTATPGVTLRLPSGPTHTVTVTSVDQAGNESRQSAPVTFTVPFIPVP